MHLIVTRKKFPSILSDLINQNNVILYIGNDNDNYFVLTEYDNDNNIYLETYTKDKLVSKIGMFGEKFNKDIIFKSNLSDIALNLFDTCKKNNKDLTDVSMKIVCTLGYEFSETGVLVYYLVLNNDKDELYGVYLNRVTKEMYTLPFLSIKS